MPSGIFYGKDPIMTRIKSILSALSLLVAPQIFANDSATYDITFTSLWNEVDHVSFPNNAHFSPILAVSHNANYEMFSLGSLASPGFEQLAETGSTRTIQQEIRIASNSQSILDVVKSATLWPRRDGDSISFTVDVSRDHPQLSIATMIAPSPDWVVGISNLELVNAGSFVSEYQAYLYAINAGTENGDVGGNFSTNNRATSPREAISGLFLDTGFTKPFARIVIKRQ